MPGKSKTPQVCEICGVNSAVVKNYISFYEGTDHEAVQKIPSCLPCVDLTGRSVQKLVSSNKMEKRRLIKKWWNPASRDTLLPEAYPSVNWEKVRLSRRGA